MSIPTNLFIDAPEMHDPSMHQLDNDPQGWPEEIVQKLKERIPTVAQLSSMCKFMKVNEEIGTATGSVVVNNAQKSAVIPVIIKDFNLYPMDVFIADNKLLPLTEEYFNIVFHGEDALGELSEFPNYGGIDKFDGGSLWNTIYPPNLGRYAYASAGFSVLDSISDTIKDNKEFLQHLKENPADLIRFRTNGHSEIIEKLASINMNEFGRSARDLMDRRLFHIKRNGPNKYTILSNSEKVFSPVIAKKNIDMSELSAFISEISDCAQDDINDIDRNGEKVILPKTEIASTSHHPVGDVKTIEMATEYDNYVVRKNNGVEVEGVVIPKVITFDMTETGQKIFLGKTCATIQDNIAGKRIQNSRFSAESLKCCPQPGQTGCFVYMPNKSKAIATIPVTIESVMVVCDQTKLKAMDLLGRPMRIKICKDHSLQRIALVNEEYMIPEKMFWVPMSEFPELSNSVADFLVKTASWTKHAATIVSLGYNQFTIKGLNKYAQAMETTFDQLSIPMSKFILASVGVKNIDTMLKTAQLKGKCVVEYTPVETIQEKVAAAAPRAEKLIKTAKQFKSNLIKIASFMENAQNVDSLLSLNFVNPDNIAKFVSKIPVFKATISQLASCLLASRLGIKEIPESATSSAIQRMIEVVNGLETLRATQER